MMSFFISSNRKIIIYRDRDIWKTEKQTVRETLKIYFFFFLSENRIQVPDQIGIEYPSNLTNGSTKHSLKKKIIYIYIYTYIILRQKKKKNYKGMKQTLNRMKKTANGQ